MPYGPVPSEETCAKWLAAQGIPAAPSYLEWYRCKPDFAEVEYRYPLRREDRLAITPANVKAATQEQVDQIYARLTAGPIPHGTFQVHLFQALGTADLTTLARVLAPLDGAKGQHLAALLSRVDPVEFGTQVWRAKVFDRPHQVVRTKIPRKPEDRLPGLLVMLEPLLGSPLAKVPVTALDTPDAWQVFPAKVYCGESLLDGRRESLILDYAFSHQVEGYRQALDSLMGPRGLHVREEIRLVRPGFYLGRVYMGRLFVMNLVLYSQVQDERDTQAFVETGVVQESCDLGSQLREVQRPRALTSGSPPR
ncbi:MAG: hypothetical protein ACREI3_11150 [Nitrospirales bacterium]